MIMDSVRDLSKEKDIIRIIGRMPDHVLEECVGYNFSYGNNRWRYYLCPVLLLILLFVPGALKVFICSFH